MVLMTKMSLQSNVHALKCCEMQHFEQLCSMIVHPDTQLSKREQHATGVALPKPSLKVSL